MISLAACYFYGYYQIDMYFSIIPISDYKTCKFVTQTLLVCHILYCHKLYMVSVPSNAGFYCWCIQFAVFFYSRPLNFAINPDEFDLQCVKKPKVPRVCIYNFSEFELTNFKPRSWWCFNSDLTDFTKYHTLKAFCVKHFMQTI